MIWTLPRFDAVAKLRSGAQLLGVTKMSSRLPLFLYIMLTENFLRSCRGDVALYGNTFTDVFSSFHLGGSSGDYFHQHLTRLRLCLSITKVMRTSSTLMTDLADELDGGNVFAIKMCSSTLELLSW